MENKIKKISAEEQLLNARKRGLQEAAEVDSMRPHGKVFGMDAFSWVNPQLDTLAKVIETFPFSMKWIGTHQQIKSCLETYPELTENIDTIVIYDRSLLNVDRTLLSVIPNILCVEGTWEALSLVKSMQQSKNALLFTSERNSVLNNKELFEQFISENR